MADSKKNKSGQNNLNKKDDLDALLDNADLSNLSEDPFDEETIDRLLMDNAPDEKSDEEAKFEYDDNMDENEMSDDEEINEYLKSDSIETNDDIEQVKDLPEETNREEGLPEDFDISNGSGIEGENQNEFEFSDEDIEDELIGDEENNDFIMEDFHNENHHSDEIFEKEDEEIESLQFSDLKEHINKLWRESEDTADDFISLKNEYKEISQRNKFINYLTLGLAVFAVIVAGSMVMINSKLQIQVDEILATESDSSKFDEVSQRLNDIQLQLTDIKNNNQMNSDNQQQINELLKAKISEIEKNITPINEQIKKSENKTENKTVQKGKQSAKKPSASAPRKTEQLITRWHINLVSLNQEWQAKKKAEEFRKKGIPAEVSQVFIKGKKWYRILVGGFKTKQEAQSYVPKVKKVLSLDSVWVTSNK